MEKIEDGLYMHEGRPLLLGREKDWSRLYTAKLILPSDRSNYVLWENIDHVIGYIRKRVDDLPDQGIYWHANFPMRGNRLDSHVNPSALEITGSFGNCCDESFGEYGNEFPNPLNESGAGSSEYEKPKENYFGIGVESDLPIETCDESIPHIPFSYSYGMVEDARASDALDVWEELLDMNLDHVPELIDSPYARIFNFRSRFGAYIHRKLSNGEYNPDLN